VLPVGVAINSLNTITEEQLPISEHFSEEYVIDEYFNLEHGFSLALERDLIQRVEFEAFEGVQMLLVLLSLDDDVSFL
jgi:hypothetical protein